MSATVFEKQGSRLTVKPEGRLDTATSPILESEMQPYLDTVQDVVMDFTKVEYISSGGLRLMLTTDQQLESRGGSMKIIHVNENILEIFSLVGFTDIITVEQD
ncbi:MAG: STAS domain-containing protein [Clostridia bacterium]|nr:STAS domain-containing protein [Clostridia bacterium]MBQ6232307.1 STAS domain-containing protein [Clostridia bacterium]